MSDQTQRTAKYRVQKENDAYSFTFFCASSGAAVCTAKPVRAASEQEALDLAWKREGHGQFNLCHRCGRWVADVMYNADTLKCVDCSPWEEPPQFCPLCGAKVDPEETFCHECKNRLRYGTEEVQT